MDENERPPQSDDVGDPGAAPTLGNAVYRWARSTLGPLPYRVRLAVVAVIVAFLVVLPLVLFLMLLNGT